MSSLSSSDEIVSQVPEFERFLTVAELDESGDALAAAHPGVTLGECGRSRAGHPIRRLDVGPGPLRAVLYALPHPEEPFGTLLLEYLLPLLADGLAAELGYRFSIVKVADPDGARLNEPWFDDPYDLAGQLARVYRPAPADMMEWSFPFAYKGYAYTRPLPEAAALMTVIDSDPVDVIAGLHDTMYSGAYFYVSEADADYARRLAAVAHEFGLPLHRGEPEVPYLEAFGDGVYRSFGLRDEYDYLQRYGQSPAAVLDSGTSADDYAASAWGSFSLTAEIPHFTSSRIADSAPAGLTRREAKLRGLEIEQRHVDWLRRRYPEVAERLSHETPWLRTVHAYLMHAKSDLEAERRMVAAGDEFSAEATVAQLFDSVYLRELYALRVIGQFGQMAAADADADDLLAETARAARSRVRERAAHIELAGGLTPVPLRVAVQAQLAALLCTLEHVRDDLRPAVAGGHSRTRP